MAKRKKNKGGLAAALICLFMAAATLLRGGRIDLPAVSDVLGEVSDAVSDLSQTPAEPVDGLFEMIALDVGQGGQASCCALRNRRCLLTPARQNMPIRWWAL